MLTHCVDRVRELLAREVVTQPVQNPSGVFIRDSHGGQIVLEG